MKMGLGKENETVEEHGSQCLELHCPINLVAVMETFSVCTVQFNTHEQHM